MKKYLLAILIILLYVVPVQSASVSRVVGLVGSCDTTASGCTPIPTTVTALCGPNASCPNLSAQSFTNTSRFWGGPASSCRTSSDGGVTWGACTTATGLNGAMMHLAGASDGSTIAVGNTGASCIIKRSIDDGTNWTTVYSNVANIGCGSGTNGGTNLKCLSDGRCTFAFENNITNLPAVLESTDNGQNWVLSSVGSAVSLFISLAWDGTAGILSSNTFRSIGYASGAWSQGAAAFPGCGTISGSVVYNGVGYGICKATGVNENYLMLTAAGVLFKTLTLPGALQSNSGALAISVGTNNLYMIAGKAVAVGNTPAGIWVSRDAGVTFTLIHTTSQALNSLTQNNDIFFSNGCIYFSGGTSPIFGKIC